MARRLNVDPFKYLYDRFNDVDDHDVKVPLALELMPYCYPKLKAVDYELVGGGAVTINIGGQSVQALPNDEPKLINPDPNEVSDDER